ncbi:MAG: lysophospholipid acyltransferase family protein [Gemmatimonadetes bacterium]|nr:lysophospholipid acyltransferase family protein [Gemmatimonadota bacterium]
MIPSAPVVRLAVRLLGVVPAAPVHWLARLPERWPLVWPAADGRSCWRTSGISPLTRRRQRSDGRHGAPCATCSMPPSTCFTSHDAAGGDRATDRDRGAEHLDAALALGKGVVVATAHLGPYEFGGAWLALAGYPVHAMVEDIDPETNAAMALYRKATGMKLISRSGGLRAAIRVLRDREILLLVADRVVGRGSEGLAVPFGDGVRAVPTGPAALALATGAPIVTGHIARNRGRGPRYLVRLEAPISATPTGDTSRDRDALTGQVAQRLAAAVQAHPDQWFVFQPEWIRLDTPSRD